MAKPVITGRRIISAVIMLGCFGLSYWLSRFALFDWHGMKSWPNTLALFGLISIMMAIILDYRKIAVATIVGYIAGFFLAMIFNTDGVDPGGGTTNNAWLIWGSIFILFILAAVIWSFFSARLRKRKGQ